MIPGMKDLPLSAQVVFWILVVFSTGLLWIAVYLVKRYIENQDATLKAHEDRLAAVSQILESVSNDLKEVSTMTVAEFNSFRKEIMALNEGIRSDTKKFIRVLATESRKLENSLTRLKSLEENHDRLSTVVRSLSERLFQISDESLSFRAGKDDSRSL